MRIVSLLPSATEIVCALGARDELVGRSHECDHPSNVHDVRVMTTTRLPALRSSRAIDAFSRTMLTDATSIYDLDVAALEASSLDVIVTQDLCDLCAVPIDDVRATIARLSRLRGVRLVNLGPLRLADVWSDIRRTADAIGRREVGISLVRQLEARMDVITTAANASRVAPTVLTITWIDPLMIGGLWMPELVMRAGGTPLASTLGGPMHTLDAHTADLDPDIVVVAPCGFTIERTLAELDALRAQLPNHWRAVRERRVYVADGNAFFNRPGPRLVESLEMLASCIHPHVFGEAGSRHAHAVTRLPFPPTPWLSPPSERPERAVTRARTARG